MELASVVHFLYWKQYFQCVILILAACYTGLNRQLKILTDGF